MLEPLLSSHPTLSSPPGAPNLPSPWLPLPSSSPRSLHPLPNGACWVANEGSVSPRNGDARWEIPNTPVLEVVPFEEVLALRTTEGVFLIFKKDGVQETPRLIPGSSNATSIARDEETLLVLHDVGRRLERWDIQRGFTRPHKSPLSISPERPLASKVCVLGGRGRVVIIESGRCLLGAPRGLVNNPWPLSVNNVIWAKGTLDGKICALLQHRPAADGSPWTLMVADPDRPDLPPTLQRTPISCEFTALCVAGGLIFAAAKNALHVLNAEGQLLDLIPWPRTQLKTATLCAEHDQLVLLSQDSLYALPFSALTHLNAADNASSAASQRLGMTLVPPISKNSELVGEVEGHWAWRRKTGVIFWTTPAGSRGHLPWLSDRPHLKDEQRTGATLLDVHSSGDDTWCLYETGVLEHYQHNALVSHDLILPTPRRIAASGDAVAVMGSGNVTFFKGPHLQATLRLDGSPRHWTLLATPHGWIIGDTRRWYEVSLADQKPTLTMHCPRDLDDVIAHPQKGQLWIHRGSEILIFEGAQRTEVQRVKVPSNAKSLLMVGSEKAVIFQQSDGLFLCHDLNFEASTRILRIPATPLQESRGNLLIKHHGARWWCPLPQHKDPTPTTKIASQSCVPLRDAYHSKLNLKDLEGAAWESLLKLGEEASFRWPETPSKKLSTILPRAARALAGFDILWSAPGIPRAKLKADASQVALKMMGAASIGPRDLRELGVLLEPETLGKLIRTLG